MFSVCSELVSRWQIPDAVHFFLTLRRWLVALILVPSRWDKYFSIYGMVIRESGPKNLCWGYRHELWGSDDFRPDASWWPLVNHNASDRWKFWYIRLPVYHVRKTEIHSIGSSAGQNYVLDCKRLVDWATQSVSLRSNKLTQEEI